MRLAGPLGMASAIELCAVPTTQPRSGRRLGSRDPRRGPADGPIAAKTRLLLGARRRRFRPAVVSFSGLDGSGKSTQVTRLKDELGELESPRSTTGRGSRRCAAAVAVPDLGPAQQRVSRNGTRPADPHALHGSRIGTTAWGYMVVCDCAHLWRFVLLRPRGTKLLVFDRYSPDTMVKLDLRFTRMRGIDIRWQRKLFEDEPQAGRRVPRRRLQRVAYGRRQEQTPQELADIAGWPGQVPRYRLHQLDGTPPADELAKEIVTTVWRGLR